MLCVPPEKGRVEARVRRRGPSVEGLVEYFFKRGNPAVCAKCYKAGRALRREPPKRLAETSDEHG
eukprot:2152515-Pyramimonas_sp.AAC.1